MKSLLKLNRKPVKVKLNACMRAIKLGHQELKGIHLTFILSLLQRMKARIFLKLSANLLEMILSKKKIRLEDQIIVLLNKTRAVILIIYNHLLLIKLKLKKYKGRR